MSAPIIITDSEELFDRIIENTDIQDVAEETGTPVTIILVGENDE